MADFKVIVVGGGPTGLITAHALHKAGIDFVLLERGPTCHPDIGSGVGFWPMSLRVLDQLDILDAIRPVMNPTAAKKTYTWDGTLIQEEPMETLVCNGEHFNMCHRTDLLKALYDSLPDAAKSRVKTNKRVTDISVSETGVVVTSEDGTAESGSIVIGADGVHSKVRQIARQLAIKENPKAVNLNLEMPFTVAFDALIGNFQNVNGPAGLTSSVFYETHSTGYSTQVFRGTERTWFIVYRRLKEPRTEKSQRVVYTEESTQKFADEIADMHITDKLVFRQLFDARERALVVPLEEGVTTAWHYKRLVNVGDATHKMTPNSGMGLNSSVQDVTVLVNKLHALVSAAKAAEHDTITTEELEKAFGAYRAQRQRFVDGIVVNTARELRMVSWGSTYDYVMDRWVWPLFGWRSVRFRKGFALFIAACQVLDFAEIKHPLFGSTPWKNFPKVEARGDPDPYDEAGVFDKSK
ncbi:hypothetical protein B0H63DRAFT_421669 [Podospora didyma]|uniref:FAD-binding domain-containing protein n=1 Tax=Podospora didyma TaxID=330526 RepID=A0AAE0K620_9PEZI|nr:hypothetical protein B0H63DRAFT_421669 [Podospora didyma]